MAVLRMNGFDQPVKVAMDPDGLIQLLQNAAELGTKYISLPTLNAQNQVVGQLVIQPEKITALLIEEDGRGVHMDRKAGPDDE